MTRARLINCLAARVHALLAHPALLSTNPAFPLESRKDFQSPWVTKPPMHFWDTYQLGVWMGLQSTDCNQLKHQLVVYIPSLASPR